MSNLIVDSAADNTIRRGARSPFSGRETTVSLPRSGEEVILTVLTVTGEVVAGRGIRAGSRTSSGGCDVGDSGLWNGDARLTTTVSLPRSGEAVTGCGISLDQAVVTSTGGCRPVCSSCCCGMGISLAG